MLRAGTNRRRLGAVLINSGLVILSMSIGGGLMEFGLRLFNPFEIRIKGEQINLPYFKRYVIDYPDADKLEKHIVHSRNALGFRGENPPREFDRRLTVLAVGGSTTESFYIADGKTWPELVGRKLRTSFPGLWINNAGLSGHSSFGHLRQMEQHVVRLRPKVVLFLVGINDRAKERESSFDNAIKGKARIFDKIKRKILNNSELLSLLWSILKTLKATELGINGKEVDFAALPSVSVSQEDAAAEIHRHRPFLRAFRGRLHKLVDISTSAGIVPVLITQPTAFGAGIDDATGRDLEDIPAYGFNGHVAWRVLELYNDVTRAVAMETRTNLIDLAWRMKRSTRFYRDLIHFSNEGSKAVASEVGAGLCPILTRHFPTHAIEACAQSGFAGY